MHGERAIRQEKPIQAERAQERSSEILRGLDKSLHVV